MKNSSANSVANPKRIRANAVWLMNAASLAAAISAVNHVAQSNPTSTGFGLISQVKAADYFYAGGNEWKTGAGQLIGWWTGVQTAGANGSSTNAGPTTFAGTDNIYFGSSTAVGAGLTWYSTINLGSSSINMGSMTFVSGSNNYTFNASNQRLQTFGFGIGSLAAGANVTIDNQSSSAITFNTLIRDKNGSQAATAHTWQQSNSQGSLIFAGTLANSYQINPYAYDWAISVGSNAAQATTFASGGITGQAFALADANSGNHFQKLAGAGTITVSGAIGDASRLVNGTSTNGWNSAGVGHLIITNTGTTNLQGWNTYTGSTYIGDGTTTGGTVKISSPYAFGGNRQTDTTAPNWFSAVTGSGTGYTNGFTTAAGVTGLAAYRGAASGTFANGSIATGFKDATVAFGTVAIAAGFSLDLNGVTMLGSNALTINGVGSAAGQGVLKNSNATGATYIGSVTLGSDSNITAGTGNITLTGGLATSTYTASIDGAQNTIISSALTGTGSINKSGAGTLTLSGNNTYTGSLTINNGTVNLAGTGSALGTGTGALTFGATNTPTLNLGGRSITVGNISSSNTSALISNVNASAATLTSSAPGSTTFAGKITDGVGGGALSLVKAGSGTLTLSGANTYTGNTTISGGTLSLTGTLASNVTVNSTAVFAGTGTTTGTLTVSGSVNPGTAGIGNLTAGATTLAQGGTLNVQIYDFNGTAGTGWDLLTSTGGLTVSSTSDLSSNLFTINVSSISSSTANTVGNALNFSKSSPYSLKILTGTSVTGFDVSKFSVTGSLQNAGAGVWSVANVGNDINLVWTASSSLNWNGASGWDGVNNAGGAGTWSTSANGYDTASVLLFGGTAGAVTVGDVSTSKAIKFQVDGYTLSGGTITLTGADSATNNIDVGTGYTASIGSKIVSSTSTIYKTGTGTLVLSGANGSSGISSGIQVSAGTLQIASAGALGSSASNVTVSSGATLDLNGQTVSNTNALTISGTGAGSAGGALINTNTTAASYAGLLTLGAATTINASSGNITLSNSGTITGSGYALTVTGSSDTTINSIIGTGTAGITKTGNGTLTLGGANTFTGNVAVNAGRLQLANAQALGTSSSPAVTVASGATLDLNGQSVSNTNALTISGTGAGSYGGALVNAGTGAATFAGLLTLGAASTINASSGNITLSNVGTITGSTYGLTVTGSANTIINSIIGTGTGGITKNGSGTLTLNGSNTYSGAVNINAGTLKIGTASAIGTMVGTNTTAAVNVLAGGTFDLNGQTISSAGLIIAGTGASGGALINSSTTAAAYNGPIGFSTNATISAVGGDITLGAALVGGATVSNLAGRTYQLTVDGAYNTTINYGINSSTNATAATNGAYVTFVKNGTGTLTLNGYNNASTGPGGASLKYVNGQFGVVKIGHTQALGGNGNNGFGLTWSGYGNYVVINDGGTLDVNSIVYNKSPILILSGTGAAGAGGAIINSNSSSQAKMQGVYLLAGDTTISDNSTGGLDINANSTNFKSFNIKNYTLTLAGSNTAGNDVITTSIIGSGNIIKKGTGTWVLNPGSTSATGYLDYNAGVYSTQSAQAFANTNFFTGSVDIQQGTLKLGQTAALGSSNAAGYSSGVTVQSGATLDLAGKVVAAPVALTLAGTGAAGAGGALINSSSTTANYSGLLTLSDNTTINSSVGSIIISNVGTITGAGKSLTIDGGFNTTINSIIGTGSGGITKNGTGTLTLTGANTLTGNIAVNAGRLQMGSNDALGTSSSPSITVASGATLDLNSNTPTNTNALTISGTGAGSYGGALVNSSVVAASTYSGSITLADDTTISPSSANLILSGKISGNHTLTIGGTAATKYVSLTGASANTMGGINLAGYDLAFTNVNQLGNGTITSSSANAKLVYGPSSSPAATNQSFELSNALNTGADSAKILTISPNDSSNTITLSGAISGSGKLKIGGGGTLVITNTSNSFSGGLEIGTGSISVANDSALGAGTVNFGTATSSALYFTDNNTVSRNFTLGSSSYTANIDVASGKTVQLDGVISPVSTGGKLNKTGNGELILTGVNTYTSSTTITAGTLTLKNSGSAAQASLTVNTGATFKADGTSAVNSSVGSITLNSGALVDLTLGSIKGNNLTVAALTGTDTTSISYTFGKSLVLGGTPTLNGDLNLIVDGTSAVAGRNNLITWTGSKSGTGSFTSTLNNTPTGLRSVLKTGSNFVSADYYTLATADASQTVNFGNVRVGVNNTAALTLTNNSASGTYSEQLSSNGFSNTSSGFTATGSASIAGGASGSGTLAVGITAATAGAQSGSTTLALQSTAVNSSGLSAYDLSSQTITITGAAYDLASPTYATTTKAFGNVRTGATVSSQNINFANTTITNASYQDSLDVSGSNTNSAITLGNGFNVAAGNNANLSVSANTATAGSLNDTITLSLTSNANGVSGLSNSSITPTGTVAVTGAVYDYAQAKFDGTALDFGYVHQGATVSSQNVAIGNKTITNASYQDKLDVSGSSDNANVSVSGFTGLVASTNGSSTSNLAVGVDSSTLGTLNGTLSLTLTSNANGVLGLSDGTATRSGSGNITTTGTVYSGQATWNTDGSGSWGKVSSGFGSNWGANQGSPGLDSGFTNTDTATFGSAISSDATVSLNGASPKLKSITFNNTNASYTLATGSSGDITLNAGASDSAATIAVTGNHTISAVLKGSSQIDKTGSGTLTLSGVNTYTGLTNVTNGTLNLASTGSIASSDVAVSKAATLKATNSAISDSAIVGGITLNSGALVDLTSGSLKATSLTVGALSGSDVTKISYTIGNSLALTGGLTLNGNLTIDLTSSITGAGTYDVFTWSGSRSGSGVFALVDHSNSDWAMSGSETSGKYTITITSAFTSGGNYNSGNVTIPSGQTLGNVSGSANVTASSATTITGISGGTVTLNASGNTVGAISNGTLNLKSGGNTVDTISGGAVTVEGSGSTIAGLTGGSLNVKADTTLTSLTGGTLTVDSGVNAEVKAGTSTATITGAGNLLKSGNGKLTLSGTGSDYTGATKITGGELEVTNVAALGATSGVSLGTASSSTAATFNYSGGAATISQNITALSTSQSGNTVQNTGTGLLTLSGNLTKNGTVLTLSGGSQGINVTGNIVGANANSDLVVSSGVVTVSSSNSYNGPTFIQSGATLVANNASATGLGIVNVANGGTLQVGTAANILTLTTGGFALSDGAHIKVYVDHIDITGLTSYSRDGVTHYDLTNTAGTAYSTLFTSGALDVSGVTAGGITIDVYSTDTNTPGFLRAPFYDFKFLESATVSGLGSGLNIADLFTINTDNLKYANGTDSVKSQYDGHDLSYLVHVYQTTNNDGHTVLMMSIPEPSTYGLGLGALALAAVAIRRRKQKKATV